MLLKTQEIISEDDTVIHIRFLKDTTDFELFLNGQQIDNSETSPSKVADSLRWPIYISMSWYILVLVISGIVNPRIYELIFNSPKALYNHPIVIYLITSSFVVLIVLVLALWMLKKGNLLLYYLALIVVCADLLLGIVTQLPTIIFAENGRLIIFLLYILLPLIFKSAVIRSFLINIKKYKEFIRQKAQEQPKMDAELVDI